MEDRAKTPPRYGLSAAIILPGIIVVVGLLVFFYYYTSNQQNQTTNRHYLRQLGEVTKTFNNNLNQIYVTRRYTGSSGMNTTYSVNEGCPSTTAPEPTGESYFFSAGNFVYTQPDQTDKMQCWQLPVRKLLPKPSGQFSQYLLVTPDNEVLATQGDLRAFSVIDTRQVGRQIAVELNRDWLELAANFNDRKTSNNESLEAELPGFSYYTDLHINSGEYRLYLFPFIIDTDFPASPVANTHQLYLIGVVPKSALNSDESKRWALSNYLLTLLLLAFLLVIARLFMLSQHQPVDSFFYHATLYSSFLLFSGVSSAYFAYTESQLENAQKSHQALQYAQQTREKLTDDLRRALQDLNAVADFYRDPSGATQAAENWQTQSPLCQQEFVRAEKNASFDQMPQKKMCVYFGRRMHTQANCHGLVNCQWFDAEQPKTTSLLHAFTVNRAGIQVGPQFYDKEFQRRPEYLDLSHRDYFRKILDHQGFEQPALTKNLGIEQFYIQRLRSVTTGALATTLSVPLRLNNTEFRVLAADISLPSVTREPNINAEALADITLLVVDRNIGSVLYHTDSSRVLNENLFSSGRDTDAIRHAIQVGHDSTSERGPKPIAGNYQGMAGWFISHASPIDQWAIVTFYPRESINNYFSNIFFVNFYHFVAVLLAGQWLLWGISQLRSSNPIKRLLRIPACIEARKLQLFLSVLVFSQIAAFWLGYALNRHFLTVNGGHWAMTALAGGLTLGWGIIKYVILKDKQSRKPLEKSYKLRELPTLLRTHLDAGALWLLVIFAGVALLLSMNLQRVGYSPAGALHWYYANQADAQANVKADEIVIEANQLYPSSISQFDQDPFQLMATTRPRAYYSITRQSPGLDSLSPDTISSFSQLTQLTGVSGWLNRYLLMSTNANTRKGLNMLERKAPLSGYLVLVPVGALVLVGLWVIFNQRLLYGRLFGTENLLRFLNRLYRHSIHGKKFSPDPDLLIRLPRASINGQPLNLLLEGKGASSGVFQQLLTTSERLKTLVQQPDFCPHITLHCELNNSGGIEVSLLNLTANLQTKEQRDPLLALIRVLKQVKQSGGVSRLTLFCNYESLVMLLAINNLRDSDSSTMNMMSGEEYSDWAYCLRDFTVSTAIEKSYLDHTFIHREIEAMPALGNFIQQPDQPDTGSPDDIYDAYRWVNLPDRDKTSAEWYSIRYIQLKAGAYYRTLWSSCAPPEKLALFYLAHNKRVNPNNSKVLENLATRGLVSVYRGRLRIVNRSFAAYLLHAENTDSLRRLIQQGDMGVWNDYKFPIYMLTAAALVALTLVSGNSLYMIVSSALGVLALVSNLLTGVGFIRTRLSGS